MKRLALIVGGITLFGVEEAFAAITCTASPDCATLGYNDTAGSCTNYVACPFDTSKVACLEKDCTDYTSSSCPTGGSCSVYQNSSGTKYKLDSCNTGYKLDSSGTSCTAKTCSDYGYMESMPSSSEIGSGCSGKEYDSCSSKSITSGNVNKTCYSCISNPYGIARSKVIYCSSSQGYAGAGDYCCGSSATAQNCDGTGGCMKMD